MGKLNTSKISGLYIIEPTISDKDMVNKSSKNLFKYENFSIG